MTPYNKDAPKPLRFRIWSICLLIVFLSAPIVFVIRVASRPSEPFISVSFYSRTDIPSSEYGMKAISTYMSNRMSFNVGYSIEEQVFRSGKWVRLTERRCSEIYLFKSGTLTPLSEQNLLLMVPPEGARIYFLCHRQLKPLEVSVLNKLPWLTRHCPFHRSHKFTIYEPVSDFQVSSET